MWVCVYLFTVHSSRYPINHSILGCILLILLFQGSMAFSESITLSKYPVYADYQLSTPQCFPKPRKGKGNRIRRDE